MAEIGDRPRWLLCGLLPGLADAPVLVVYGHQPAPPDTQEISAARICAVLPRCLAASDGRRGLLALYRAVVPQPTRPPQAWTDREITDHLLPVVQQAFDRRRLIAYSAVSMGSATGGTGPVHSQPPLSKPPPVKPPPVKPPPAKPPKIGPPRIEWVKIESLTIHSDHQMMKDNLDDWLDTGIPYPEPEWTGGQGCALSHSMNQPVELTVELMVGPPDAVSEPGVLQGKAAEVSFQSEVLDFVPGPMTIPLTSKQPLDPKIRQSTLSISWEVDWWQGDLSSLVSPTSTDHVIYVTWDTPRLQTSDEPPIVAPEHGVTHQRMKRAVEWVEQCDSLDPHEIVAKLFHKVPGYALHKSEHVPDMYYHPGYFNNEGGAWPLTEYPQHHAQCQAIIRMVRAILHQVGLPGRAQNIVVWSDPDIAGGKEVLEAPLGQGGLYATCRWRHGYLEHARLSDSEVMEWQTYTDAPGSPGMNKFEACLKYDHANKVKYHGGGMTPPEEPYETKEQVFHAAFWGLVWIREHKGTSGDPDEFTVTEIVHQWK